MINIITERLRLRYFKPSDWKDLYEYLSDEEVLRFEPYGAFNEEQCQEEARRRSENKDFLAVCLKDTDKVIGNIYFSKQDFGTWELGYVFNAAYQGKGYASESVRALLNHYFTEGMARRVVALCNPENEASWKLLERLRLRREGHLKQNIYFNTDENDNPIWQDTYEYAILAEEWDQL